jgi:uncharacterized membrane protein YkoI
VLIDKSEENPMKVYPYTVAMMAVGLLPSINVKAEDKELKQSEVPQVVLDAFSIAKPTVKVTEYELKTRDGKPFYEIEYKHKGVKYEYFYAADGTLLETGEEMYPSRLPTELKQAIKATYPQAKIKEVKTKMMADGNPSGYEIELKENGKEVELDIDVNGKITRVELDN